VATTIADGHVMLVAFLRFPQNADRLLCQFAHQGFCWVALQDPQLM